MFRLVLVNLLFLFLIGCSSSPVKESELNRLFVGARVTGEHVIDGYSFEREYADETFIQAGTHSGSGWWRIQGDQLCITWLERPDKPHELCRHVRTDDRGSYWKELRKDKIIGGGKTKYIQKTVVRYTSIVDAKTGAERRQIKSFLEVHLMRLAGVGTAVVVAFGAAGLALRSLWNGSREAPYSRQNLARRKRPVEVGTRRFDWDVIKSEPEELGICLDAACRASDFIVYTWAKDALEKHGAAHIAYTRIATWLLHCPEARLQATVEWLRTDYNAASLLDHTDQDDQIARMGIAYRHLATAVHTSNESAFDFYKAAGELFLGGLRERLPGPTTVYDASVRREVTLPGHPLQADVVMAYEGLLYMKYTPPVPAKRTGSAYSGGG